MADEALEALRKAVGDGAREAGEGDAVAGVPARYVVSPASTAETADVLRASTEHGLAVSARGAGTKLAWGNAPERVDVLLDTSRLGRLIEHVAGDLVVQVETGHRLDALQEALAPAGQRLAVDPVVPGGTVGGTIATAASGPLRLLHGAVRDLLIGVTVVRADGVVARGGSKVVKNVAGYDLPKLFAGSWGTLGIVTEAIFRLHPVPEARRWVSAQVDSLAEAHRLLQAVVHSQVVPSAVELDRPADGPMTLSVLLEGIAPGVEGRTATTVTLLGSTAQAEDAAPGWWGAAPWPSGGTALRITSEIAGLPRLLESLQGIAAQHGLAPALRGAVAVGLVHAGLPADADPAAVTSFVDALRQASPAWGGDVVVLDAPVAVREQLDLWGPVRGLDLMRRVKEQFDPQRRLSPGRFVGGI